MASRTAFLASAALVAVLATASSANAQYGAPYSSQPAEADQGFIWSDWSISVGAGAQYAPDYEGSDDYEWTFLPLVSARWRDMVSVGRVPGGLGAQATPFRYGGFSAGFGLAYWGGRDDGDNAALAGLGDIDPALVGSISVANRFDWAEVYADFRQDLTGNRDGTAVKAGVRAPLPTSETGVLLTAGASTTWVDEDYMDKTFGVNAVQAARTGYANHDADGGFKDVAADVTARYAVTDSVSVLLGGEVKQLLGDAADSPIVDNRGSPTQARVFGGVTYRF